MQPVPMIPTDEEICEARSGSISYLGKLDQKVSTVVDIDTDVEFRRKCALAGSNSSEMLRDFIFMVSHGKTFSELQAESAKVKRDSFFSTWAQQVQNRTKP